MLDKTVLVTGGTGYVGSWVVKYLLENGYTVRVTVRKKTNIEKYQHLLDLAEKSEGAIIVASYGTFSTGINIRNLHNIIFSSPSKSRIRNLQSIGRGLRVSDNKVETVLYDIADDLNYKSKENYTLKHFQERINIYNEEEFDYEIHNINLKD